MGHYLYLKSPPKKPKKKIPRRLALTASIISLLVGIFLLGQVLVPIVGWYLFTLPVYSGSIVSPLATNFRPEHSPLYPAIVRASDAFTNANDEDSYRPATWFNGLTGVPGPNTFSQKTYALTIPSLKIDQALVEYNGQNLKKSLVAWPTSVTPGSYGNVIIFGHSALPAISSPKDYASIFTHLMDLAEGDSLFLDYDGVRYHYQVTGKKIVSPDNLSVLEQRFDAPYLTLITCDPPGTLWMRAVITARLTSG